MPVDLSAVQAQVPQAPASHTPKFFSKSLTGTGKSQGLLNDRKRPGRYDGGGSPATMPGNPLRRKARETNGNVSTQIIPFASMIDLSIQHGRGQGVTLPVPDKAHRLDLTDGKSNLLFDAYLDLLPQGAMLQEDRNGDALQRRLDIKYRMEVHVVPHGAKQFTSAQLVASAPSSASPGSKEPFVLVDWSYGPLDDVYRLVEDATRELTGGRGIVVDDDALAEWMDQFDLSGRIADMAEHWSTDAIGDEISLHVEELFQHGTPAGERLNALAAQLLYLETYSVPLSAYRKVHEALVKHVADPAIRAELSNQNLNLLMNHVLDDLHTLTPKLQVPPGSAAKQQIAKSGKTLSLSAQQRNAVTAPEALVLVQAGAGTGKSTVIIERIDDLVHRGVDPKEITVLSFTNAAADNIIERNPEVGSMTIAKMVHEIYRANHPRHDLSSVETILNSLDIYFGTDSFVEAFRPKLLRVAQGKPGAMTELSNFVGRNVDRTVAVLDRIAQTSLELEVIMAYHCIDTMIEPASVQSRYLIIDEVQDNSIFEFVYLLKYVAKNLESMFIVGDCSQTLFEFRSANPKALNALESSGVFATYQLTTNYRSNQEILDFANVASLDDIEANQFARIRLQANSLDLPTEQSFCEAVTLDYRAYSKKEAFKQEFPLLLKSPDSDIRRWIDERIARGETVAMLAYDRNTVKQMQDAIQEAHPTKRVASLVSDKRYDSTYFSQYVKTGWNEVVVVGPASAAATFAIRVKQTLDLRGKKPDVIKAMERGVNSLVDKWWRNTAGAESQWRQLFSSGRLTADEYYENLRESILRAEIEHNAMAQRLSTQRNNDRKMENLSQHADVLVSTVHGAKGLEFPHVVVVHNYDNAMSEEMKRLYYVAFTRAMDSEYVQSFGLVKNAKIQKDYDQLVEALRDRDDIARMREDGVDVDAMTGDEVEQALKAIRKAQQDAADAAAQAQAEADAADAAGDAGADEEPVAAEGA